MRAMETPEARSTISSLPRASAPSPRSAPMSAEIGMSSKACWGTLSSANSSASLAP